MKNQITKTEIYIYLMLGIIALGVSSCTYEHDGKLVKDTDGNIYRMQSDFRGNEAYNMISLDTVKYNVMFKCK